ncbi:ThuA domain-containing protein, partial [Kibdelosporangium lantanae]
MFSTDTSPATEAGFETIRRMGATTRKFDAKISRDPKDIDPLRLQRFGVIVFLNTSAAVLNADQKATFESFFRNGGGFVGIHSAIQTQPDWQFLTDVLGTRSTGVSPVS